MSLLTHRETLIDWIAATQNHTREALNVFQVENWFMDVAQRAHTRSTTQLSLCDRENDASGAMSRNHLAAKVREDAVIAFLLFCLEIYQAEQQRKRKLH
jgi:hypothetical protein